MPQLYYYKGTFAQLAESLPIRRTRIPVRVVTEIKQAPHNIFVQFFRYQ